MADSLHIHDLHNINKNNKFFKGVLDTINEETSSTLQDSLDLVDNNYIAIKNAVETKGEDLTGIKPSGYAGKILDIESGIDTSDATAIVTEILDGETAYVNGVKITGIMPNIGVQNITPSSEDQNISEGYHNGAGVVSGESSLVTDNIKSGVTIFGVSGKTEVVDTSDANATASDIKSDKTAYVQGVKVTGEYIAPEEPIIPVMPEYVRPSDWLALPEVLETDDKMVALFAVHEADRNLVAFRIYGDYTVDWGDGIIENFTAGSTASHSYNYADLSIDTLSSRGYKQAIMVITPQSGQVISSFNIALFPTTPRPVYPCYNFLDIVLSFPNATSFGLGYTGTTVGYAYLKMIESFEMKSSFLSVSSFVYLFSCQTNLKQAIIKSSAVTDMRYMFYYCYSLTSVPLFDTSSVNDMASMFYNCYSLTSVPLFDTSAVRSMNNMFYNCYSLTSISLFDTSSVTNMSYMFYSCYALTSVSLFDTSSVTNMSYMFNSCYALTSVSLFDTSEVTDMPYMFNYCYALSTVPLFDTSAVRNMNNMFYNCYTLSTVPLFDTSAVRSMYAMFSNCYALITVPLFDTSSVTNMNRMFSYCYALKRIQFPILFTADLGYSSLEVAALVEIFNNLPTSVGQTLTITSNPGATLLSAAERAIATDKGWTLSG